MRDVLALPTRESADALAIVTDSGLFLGTLTGDSVAVTRSIARHGTQGGQVFSVDAISESPDGDIVVFDRQLHRLTEWRSDGALVKSLTLPLASLADRYVGGGGAIVAVTSRSGDVPYAPTVGELRSLDSLGYPDSVLATFPSLVLHLVNGPEGSKLLPRPLEVQPIVQWSPKYGWVVASTDSLEIHVGSAHRARTIMGTGDRAPIRSADRDSSIDAFVRSTGVKQSGQAEARSFAAATFFAGRKRLQLIDAVVPLTDGRLALRRMHLCPDREGWNLVDTAGRSAGVLAVPQSFRPVAAVTGGMLFVRPAGGALGLVRVAVAPIPIHPRPH